MKSNFSLLHDYDNSKKRLHSKGLGAVVGVISFLLFCGQFGWSQSNNLSIPFIQNYAKQAYDGGSQTWEIAQGPNGLMYFANNEGLLVFDGQDWEKYALPNGTIIRCILLDEDKIYVGGQGEFGFFAPNEFGELTYHSLLMTIPESERGFDDVWDVFFIDVHLCFRTSDKVYKLEKEGTKVYKAPSTIQSSRIVKGLLYMILREKGLFVLDKGQFIPLQTNVPFANGQVVDILERSADILIIDQLNGIWQFKNDQLNLWSVQSADFFKKQRIRSLTAMKNGNIAVGTERGGVLILDEAGVPLIHINKEDGLQNNFIIAMHTDQAGQLWLGLESGIDLVQTGRAFGKIIPDGNLEGKAFAAAQHLGNIYLGTNNGLYVKPWRDYYSPLDNNGFQLVKGTEGQVWGLDVIGDDLWLGHNDGIFLVSGNRAQKIWGENGAWKFLDMGERIIAGTYQGLVAIRKNGNAWSANTIGEDFIESSRILVKESNDDLWMSHPYRGIFRIALDTEKDEIKSVTEYDELRGIDRRLDNYIFSIYDNLLVGTQKGILKYSSDDNRFSPFAEYNQYLGANAWIQRLFEDKKKNIWFVKNNLPGFLEIKDQGLVKDIQSVSFSEFPEELVGGFELIHSVDESNVLIGVEKGFVHVRPDEFIKPDSQVVLNINAVVLEDSLIYSEKFGSAETITKNLGLFSTDNRSAKFTFGVVNLIPGENIEYRYRLIGLSDHWSPWSFKREMEYPNIGQGNYEFQVEARNSRGVLSATKKIRFEIEAIWYLSKLAISIYILLFLFLLGALIFIPRSIFKKAKTQMESAHNEVLEKTQEELMALKTERLETEIKFKNRELASATMHWAQKAETLQDIKSKLEKLIQEKPESTALIKNLRGMVRGITSDARLDDSWDQFAVHFDEVHSDFLKRLREAHPQISNNDLKLCAYLKMNLSSKEIAPLLNISVRGVEASRYRMRKKMMLDKEVNLAQYIMDF